MEFIDINTKEIKDLTIDKDIFRQPYLGYLRDNDGNIIGHAHQEAYFDNDGNEYRKRLNKIYHIGVPTTIGFDNYKGKQI